MQTRKSGTNLQNVITGETYDGTYCGFVEVIVEQQVPITFDLPEDPTPIENGVVSVPCWQVLIQADPANTQNVLVGNETHGCYIVLRAGETITIPINDARKIYVRAAAGAGYQRVNWIAMI